MKPIKVTYQAGEGRYTQEIVDYFHCNVMKKISLDDEMFLCLQSEIYAERPIDYDEDDIDAMEAAYKELKEMFLAEAKEFGLTESNFEFYWD